MYLCLPGVGFQAHWYNWNKQDKASKLAMIRPHAVCPADLKRKISNALNNEWRIHWTEINTSNLYKFKKYIDPWYTERLYEIVQRSVKGYLLMEVIPSRHQLSRVQITDCKEVRYLT